MDEMQEIETLEDTVIIDNLPIYDDNWSLLGNVLRFLNKFINYKQQNADIKGCHFVAKSENQRVPAMILKFLYFRHKNRYL